MIRGSRLETRFDSGLRPPLSVTDTRFRTAPLTLSGARSAESKGAHFASGIHP